MKFIRSLDNHRNMNYNIVRKISKNYLFIHNFKYGGVAQLGAQSTQKRTLVKIEYYTHGALAQLG